MVVPKIQSAHNSEARNIINKAIEVLNVQGKTIQDLVAEGHLTPSQYAELIGTLNGLVKKGELSVYDINKNKGKIDQTYLTQELLDQISGAAPVLSEVAPKSVTSDKLADLSVGFEHLSFAEFDNRNLFNGYYVNGWLGKKDDDGVTYLSMRKNGNTVGKTAVMNVEPNTTYSLKLDSSADVLRIATHDVPPDFTIDSYHVSDDQFVEDTITTDTTNRTYTFTTNANARYLLVTVSLTGATPPLKVVEGDNPDVAEGTPKIPYEALGVDGRLHTIDFEAGTVYTSGNVVKPGDYKKALPTNKIKLGGGSIVGLHDTSTYEMSVTAWNLDGSYRGSVSGVTDKPYKIQEVGEFLPIVMKKDRSVIYKEELDEISKLFFVGYGAANEESTVVDGKHQYYLTDDIERDFEILFQPTYTVANNEDVQYNTIISDYDTTILNGSNNNGYVTKENIGTSVDGQTMYAYHFQPSMHTANNRPTTGETTTAPKIPKVVILTGLHGNEKSTVFSTYALMHMITNNHTDNAYLDYLRRNIEFVVIPVGNPDGFNRNLRRNTNDIDLNTDWDASLWFYQETGSDKNHPSGPWSQPETRAIRDLINQHLDAEFFIDYHNHFPDGQHIAFATMVDSALEKITMRGMMKGTRESQKRITTLPQDPNYIFSYMRPGGRSVSSRYYQEQGIPSITLETVRSNEFAGDAADFGPDTIEMGTILLAEVLKARIKFLK